MAKQKSVGAPLNNKFPAGWLLNPAGLYILVQQTANTLGIWDRVW